MSIKVRAVRAALRLARKKLSRKKYAQVYKSVNPYNVHTTSGVKYKFKQKPKHPHGGSSQISQRGTHYGLRGRELKVGTKMARASMWHDTRAGGSESWRNEMMRVFGGVHMSQTKEGAKKSIKLLAKDYKKRFKKKKVKKLLAGGLLYPGVRLAVKYARPLWKVATQKIYKRAGETTMSKLQIKLDKARDLQSHFSKKQLKNLTSAKIKEMGKVLPKLNAYRDKIKATAKAWLEKEYRYGKSKKVLHSEGGEVVVHHNVDRSLL